MKLQYLDDLELPITEATLAEEGVFYLPIDISAWKEQIEKICAERGYKNRDEVLSLPPSIEDNHLKRFPPFNRLL
jgi:cupin superfamily acireductone dioxygenase involved in methionine salvage